ELRQAQEREQILAEQDKKVEQTKDQRNTLESFVYDTRSKLSSAYRSFATDSEKEGITASLQETEDWLYEDSDDDSDEPDYTSKLDDLKKQEGFKNIDPIRWASVAQEAMGKLEWNFKFIMNSKPSSPKHEPVDTDQQDR
nr:heat shock 70 kDa protein 16-like [Tanacetum cinerariifolium]